MTEHIIDGMYVRAFPQCEKVVIDWSEGEPTTVRNPHLYFQKEGYEPPPKPPREWLADVIGIHPRNRMSYAEKELETRKRGRCSWLYNGDLDSPCEFGGLSDMITTGYEKEAEMNIYFGTVVYVPEEGEAEILLQPYAVVAASLSSARKEFFKQAVVEHDALPAERLYVYALELRGES